jgi:hypothetical protein
VKLLHSTLAAAGVLSLCACTVVPTPTAPSAVAIPVPQTVSAVLEGFEPAFYRAFLQNGYEVPDRLEPVRLLHGPLRVYLRTLDDDGRPVEAITLEHTERVLIDTASIWSGDAFGVVEVARGTESRERVPGWITVKWKSAADGERCGRSTVGVDGGFIELNISGACSCGSVARVYPRLIRHELGHAMGYYHTDSPADVMYGRTIAADACDAQPSARERRHARFAHNDLR